MIWVIKVLLFIFCPIFTVKQKFLLDPDAKISFEDEYGAEVDEDIFQFYCSNIQSPTLLWKSLEKMLFMVSRNSS